MGDPIGDNFAYGYNRDPNSLVGGGSPIATMYDSDIKLQDPLNYI